MLIQKLRLQRGWSQQQLAEMSGLSVRTIQRIENGKEASMESLKSLASVFEIDFSQLNQESDMQSSLKSGVSNEEAQAFEHVRKLKAFYKHLLRYVLVITFLTILNLWQSPQRLWVVWVIFPWGFVMFMQALSAFDVFSLFGPNWEKRQVEKRLGRKL